MDMDMIFEITDSEGVETGSLKDFEVDIEIGNNNDFELNVPISTQKENSYAVGMRFYAVDTEYGGILQNVKVDESSKVITFSGDTWRGMLAKKVIEPLSGQDYRVVSGEANAVIKTVVGDSFGTLFKASSNDSGININSYQFERYTDMLKGLTKMLLSVNSRLQIRYVQGPPGGIGHVEIAAVPIKELNEEYSQDTKVSFSTKDVKNGINHLICLGKGELQNRQVVHLYADKDGNISRTQTLFGADERAAVYDYGNAETLDDLIKGGKSRLLELTDFKQFDMRIDQTVAEVGDIVAGREYMTGFVIKRPITQKIIRASDTSWTVEFRVGGATRTSKAIGGGTVDYSEQLKNMMPKSGGTFTGDISLIDGNKCSFGNGAALFGNKPQHLYAMGSPEAEYVLHLGVHDQRWTLDPDVNGHLSLGAPNHKWADVYSNNAAIQTSDKNKKNSITPLHDKYLNFFMLLTPVTFKFNDGTSGRTHIGFISQDVEQAMQLAGLTDLEFAGFCRDQKVERMPVSNHIKVLDDKGQVIEKTVTNYIDKEVPNEYVYSLRYDEFIALNSAMIQKLTKRIEALEIQIQSKRS